MFWNIKDLSHYLSIKPSTLYDWASQGKIPHLKINGLIRFHKEEIDRWLETCRRELPPLPSIHPREKPLDIDTLIEKAKRSLYNPPHRRPDRTSGRKGG